MHLNRHIIELVELFCSGESNDRRGPLFKNVALALEDEMSSGSVTAQMVTACFGPPDLYDSDTMFVYFFDHQIAGGNNDEWYFHFENGKLVNSGYNARGINDLANLQDG